MHSIRSKKILAPGINEIEIDAFEIAQKAKAGQFVIVIADEKGERIPLTLAGWNPKNGTIKLIFQEVGHSTKTLAQLKLGDNIHAILGPLGKPTEIKNVGTVVCIGGGVGIAEVYPVSRAFKNEGNEVIGIIGSRSKDLIFLEKEMKDTCDQLYVTTDDGSYGQKGLVTEVLNKLFQAHKHIDVVYAIGPVPMMAAVAEYTRPLKIKTIVNLNPIMVDATGMCGACRVTVGGKTYFGCVDGPEFDGHLVDFKELRSRLNLFKEQEECLNKRCPSKNLKNG
ncbi:MAG: sulfide/dihydroorotate dehydrogenase-like FAD/NAD-binding protein [Candidatus Omnitrophica bacterium]|nr:sulfide/dihydroorotate dehydrogenase-like FAD/NAD-binding protein [Candidatus Omnitrophota bacterium]HOX55071.1 sulfide/dihydroorotate dehydrogenase-like FAD/NAD-binding protein [Candidatus Omnitrophota bacterium]